MDKIGIILAILGCVLCYIATGIATGTIIDNKCYIAFLFYLILIPLLIFLTYGTIEYIKNEVI